MLGLSIFNSRCINYSDSFIPYNITQTLWRVINDFDIVARVPVNPYTLLNGGAGDEKDLLMAKGIIKVCLSINLYASNNLQHQSMLDYCVIGTGIRIFGNPLVRPEGYSIDINTPVPPQLYITN
jgi:hypothetical protein